MVKPLSFKGDKKPKKKKRAEADDSRASQDGRRDEGPAEEDGRVVKAAKLVANPADDDGDEDDSWVSAESAADIAGPVMFVLPTEPPTALASDANGKVFIMPVERITDDDPSTAEPHDVRQVWVASRIVGTEYFGFKSRGK